MKLFTRVAIKRCARLHPDWTVEQILQNVKGLTSPAGPYRDSVTIEDVKDVVYSMPGRAPENLL